MKKIQILLDICILFKSLIYFNLSYFIFKFLKLKKEEIYLIGSFYGEEKSEDAKVLYEYIKKTNNKVYFIENNHSIDNIKRGSFKSFIVYHKSKGVFYTHSFSDILPNMHKSGLLLNFFKNPIRIFIQHGCIGLKNIDKYILSLNKTMDYMVVSSKKEKEIVEKIGIPKEKLIITGLARYDLLDIDRKSEKVFIFLTWKPLNEYKKKLQKIQNKLKDQNIDVVIGMHPVMEKNFIDIGKTIRESGLLITDDSSIAWDFFYKGCEVIFYKPESQWYIKDNLLEERIVRDEEKLLEKIKDWKQKKSETSFGTEFFKYRDKKNTSRIFQILEIEILSKK